MNEVLGEESEASSSQGSVQISSIPLLSANGSGCFWYQQRLSMCSVSMEQKLSAEWWVTFRPRAYKNQPAT